LRREVARAGILPRMRHVSSSIMTQMRLPITHVLHLGKCVRHYAPVRSRRQDLTSWKVAKIEGRS
jgi:hypothetical protein